MDEIMKSYSVSTGITLPETNSEFALNMDATLED